MKCRLPDVCKSVHESIALKFICTVVFLHQLCIQGIRHAYILQYEFYKALNNQYIQFLLFLLSVCYYTMPQKQLENLLFVNLCKKGFQILYIYIECNYIFLLCKQFTSDNCQFSTADAQLHTSIEISNTRPAGHSKGEASKPSESFSHQQKICLLVGSLT